MNKLIYCCECSRKVNARLTEGKEIYKHRPDLYSLPFWVCDKCKNFVGCHHKTQDRTQPLGYIAGPELRKARSHIHRLIDPVYQSGKISRKKLYKKISDKLGWRFHTSKLKSIEEARVAYRVASQIKAEINEPEALGDE